MARANWSRRQRGPPIRLISKGSTNLHARIMSKNSIRKSRRYRNGEAYYQYLRGLQRDGLQERLERSVEANLIHEKTKANVSKGFVEYMRQTDGASEAETSAHLVGRVVRRLQVKPPLI